MSTVNSNDIIELNNGALTHFLDGNYDKAIVMLKAAFETFEMNRRRQDPVVTSQQNFKFSQQHDAAGGKTSHHLEVLPMMDCEVDTNTNGKTHRSLHSQQTYPLASSPSTAYSMYNRALVLSSQQDCFSGVACQNRTSAVILYNLALVHHNIGIHLGVSAALPHALQLYELALGSIDPTESLADIQKLVLAVLNNMGNIYTHLFDSQNAERSLNNLRIVLSASNMITAMDEDYVFFYLNALFQEKELCFAPAA